MQHYSTGSIDYTSEIVAAANLEPFVYKPTVPNVLVLVSEIYTLSLQYVHVFQVQNVFVSMELGFQFIFKAWYRDEIGADFAFSMHVNQVDHMSNGHHSPSIIVKHPKVFDILPNQLRLNLPPKHCRNRTERMTDRK